MSEVRHNNKAYNYEAFGLKIRSEVPFMAENNQSPVADVRVDVDRLPRKWLKDPRSKEGYVEHEDATIWFVWQELGVMQIHAGAHIVIDPVENVQPSLLKQAVQSAGLGLILHQRGELTLHASAVEVEGQIVAFVGYKGAGKSTTAAAFLNAGFPLVTDDLLVLNFNSEKEEVGAYPGIPQLRLWPEAVVASLGEDPEKLPRNSEASVKRLREVKDSFTEKMKPLRAIYVLDFHDRSDHNFAVTPLSPAAACIEMVKHSYALHYLGNRGASAEHLMKTKELNRRVPICRLKRPRSLDAIPEMVTFILSDVSKEQV